MASRRSNANTIKRTPRVRLSGVWLGLIALLLHVLVPMAQAVAAPPADLTFPAACVAHGPEAAPAESADRSAPQPFSDCSRCRVRCAAVPVVTAESGIVPPPSRHAEGLAVPVASGRAEHAHSDVTYPRGPPSV